MGRVIQIMFKIKKLACTCTCTCKKNEVNETKTGKTFRHLLAGHSSVIVIAMYRLCVTRTKEVFYKGITKVGCSMIRIMRPGKAYRKKSDRV